MCKKNVLILSLFISVLLICQTAFSSPSRLYSFSSHQGQALFVRSQSTPFWQLMPYFVTQQNLGYCGVASAVMVLNALEVSAPKTPAYEPYRLFTQDNFFENKAVKQVITPSIARYGMSVFDLKSALAAYPLSVKQVKADEFSLVEFKQALVKLISTPNVFVIAGYDRKKIGQSGHGHFSPIAAYDKKSDRFLILDVARFENPPFWVKTEDLYSAMTMGDDIFLKNVYGYVVVSKK